jgi:hypothetical protein
LYFAIFVVGVSTGVRIWELEKYITPRDYERTPNAGQILPPELTQERWILEVYRTIIESLQGIAWLLLAFFVIALIAFVVVRIFELMSDKREHRNSNIQAPQKEPAGN